MVCSFPSDRLGGWPGSRVGRQAGQAGDPAQPDAGVFKQRAAPGHGCSALQTAPVTQNAGGVLPHMAAAIFHQRSPCRQALHAAVHMAHPATCGCPVNHHQQRHRTNRLCLNADGSSAALAPGRRARWLGSGQPQSRRRSAGRAWKASLF